ncbi:hypothetical protein BESB_049070 [Besnoitia besnoiti]|uniref:Transmembrane protein n=1 Tax=Besnoitia besnoiti TaxID=94643 RepID=A0A2A9MFE8_BESBE|nr:hypothetical protein BESB_049070 [Besnoitia besnoiti]PFH36715.1 hypothetical protein BESB_049070 [Besnoitia besnoiti]
MIPTSAADADTPPARLQGRYSPLLAPSRGGSTVDLPPTPQLDLRIESGVLHELPPPPGFTLTARTPPVEVEDDTTPLRGPDFTPSHGETTGAPTPKLGPASAFEVSMESDRQPVSLAEHPVEKQKPLAIWLVLLSVLFYLTLGVVIIFCISFTHLIFGGIFISAGLLIGTFGITGLVTRSRTALGMYVFLGLCLFVFMAVSWVLHVTLLSDYIRVHRSIDVWLAREREWKHTGRKEDAPFFIVDPYELTNNQPPVPDSALAAEAATAAGQRTATAETPKIALLERVTNLEGDHRSERARQLVTQPGDLKGEEAHEKPSKNILPVVARLEAKRPQQAASDDLALSRHLRRLERQLLLERIWQTKNEEADALNALLNDGFSRKAYRLPPPLHGYGGRRKPSTSPGNPELHSDLVFDVQESPDLLRLRLPGTENGLPQVGPAHSVIMKGSEAPYIGFPALEDISANATALRSGSHTQFSGISAPLLKSLAIGEFGRKPVPQECVEGFSRDPQFLDKVGHAITALAFQGLLCAFASQDFLNFRRWPYDCERKCGFILLGTGRPYKRGDAVTANAVHLYMLRLAGMDSNVHAACEASALRTGCAVVADNYIVIAMILLAIWLAVGVCGCCVMIPVALSRNYQIYRVYKARTLMLLHSRRSAV